MSNAIPVGKLEVKKLLRTLPTLNRAPGGRFEMPCFKRAFLSCNGGQASTRWEVKLDDVLLEKMLHIILKCVPIYTPG